MRSVHTYRSKNQALPIAVFGSVCTFVVILMGFGARHDGQIVVPYAVAGCLLAGAMGTGTIRAARAGAVVTEVGVIIRNPTKTVELPWSNVEGFSLGESGIYSTVGIVHTTDGGPLRIWGIQGRKRGRDASAERLVTALNDSLSAARKREPPHRT
jgi:hypothetical protein